MTKIRLVPLPLLFALSLPAQVLPGDIAITGFSTNAFGIATSTGVVGYTTPGFGGGTSQAILHDPTAFFDFIVGGFGFVGRATVTGPGAVTYSLITTSIGTASQLSWDSSGNIIVADAGVDHVRMITPGGAVSDLSVGTQPWGDTINGGAYDPATGDVIIGNQGSLYRLVNGTTVGVLIVSGLGGYVSNVQFDPYNGDIIATVLSSNRLVRVDSAGTVTDLMPPGTVSTPNALQFDALGNYLIGSGGGQVWRVDHSGNASLIATNTSPGTSVSGLAYVQGSCYAASIGSACNGPGGATNLSLMGSCAIGSTITATSGNHTSPALGLAIYGLSEFDPPLDLGPILGANGCFLYASPDVLIGGVTDVTGNFISSVTSNNTFAGQQLFVQHAVLEGALLSSFTSSNAAVIQY